MADSALAAINSQREVQVNGALFADAGACVDLVADGLQAHAAFIQDEFEAVGPVALFPVFGELEVG